MWQAKRMELGEKFKVYFVKGALTWCGAAGAIGQIKQLEPLLSFPSLGQDNHMSNPKTA